MPNFDKSVRAFLTVESKGADGQVTATLARDDEGRTIPVATDITTGERFRKLAEQVTRPTPATAGWQAAAQKALAAQGAVFVQSHDSYWRGWWAPLNPPAAKAGAPNAAA